MHEECIYFERVLGLTPSDASTARSRQGHATLATKRATAHGDDPGEGGRPQRTGRPLRGVGPRIGRSALSWQRFGRAGYYPSGVGGESCTGKGRGRVFGLRVRQKTVRPVSGRVTLGGALWRGKE